MSGPARPDTLLLRVLDGDRRSRHPANTRQGQHWTHSRKAVTDPYKDISTFVAAMYCVTQSQYAHTHYRFLAPRSELVQKSYDLKPETLVESSQAFRALR